MDVNYYLSGKATLEYNTQFFLQYLNFSNNPNKRRSLAQKELVIICVLFLRLNNVHFLLLEDYHERRVETLRTVPFQRTDVCRFSSMCDFTYVIFFANSLFQYQTWEQVPFSNSLLSLRVLVDKSQSHRANVSNASSTYSPTLHFFQCGNSCLLNINISRIISQYEYITYFMHSSFMLCSPNVSPFPMYKASLFRSPNIPIFFLTVHRFVNSTRALPSLREHICLLQVK